MRLRTWQKDNKVKSNELAKKIGVTPVSICRWNKGLRKPRASHLVKIERLTGGLVTAADFVSEEELQGVKK